MIIKNDAEFIKAMSRCNLWTQIEFSDEYDWSNSWERFQNNGMDDVWDGLEGELFTAAKEILKHKNPLVAFALLHELFEDQIFSYQNGELIWHGGSEVVKAKWIGMLAKCTTESN